jgi:hypothetical protein
MNLSNPLLSVAATLPFAFGAARAQVIFTDTFDSGIGNWYISSTINQGGDSTLANATGQLQFTVGAAQNKDELIGRSFTEQTLAVGQTIRMTFDFRQTATTSIFRAGFTNRTATAITSDGWAYTTSGTGTGSYSGYYTFVRDASASGNAARKDTLTAFTNADASSAPTFGSTAINFPTPGTNNTTNFNINDDGTVTYQGVFEVTRTSETQVDTLFTLKSGETAHFSIPGRDTSGTLNVFDTALLRADTGTAFFDNIKVEVLPDLTTPIQVVITPNGVNYDFAWNSMTGKLYDLLTSTDLATPVSTWPVHDPDGPGGNPPFGDIPSAGATTTLTAVPSTDSRRFFAIREKN